MWLWGVIFFDNHQTRRRRGPACGVRFCRTQPSTPDDRPVDIPRSNCRRGSRRYMLGYAAAAQVMMTILPLYLQDAFVLSPAIAGLAMIPFALPLLIGPSVGGKLASAC